MWRDYHFLASFSSVNSTREQGCDNLTFCRVDSFAIRPFVKQIVQLANNSVTVFGKILQKIILRGIWSFSRFSCRILAWLCSFFRNEFFIPANEEFVPIKITSSDLIGMWTTSLCWKNNAVYKMMAFRNVGASQNPDIACVIARIFNHHHACFC